MLALHKCLGQIQHQYHLLWEIDSAQHWQGFYIVSIANNGECEGRGITCRNGHAGIDRAQLGTTNHCKNIKLNHGFSPFIMSSFTFTEVSSHIEDQSKRTSPTSPQAGKSASPGHSLLPENRSLELKKLEIDY